MDIRLNPSDLERIQSSLESARNSFSPATSVNSMGRLTGGALGHDHLTAATAAFIASWDTGRKDILDAIDMLSTSLKLIVEGFDEADSVMTKNLQEGA